VTLHAGGTQDEHADLFVCEASFERSVKRVEAEHVRERDGGTPLRPPRATRGARRASLTAKAADSRRREASLRAQTNSHRHRRARENGVGTRRACLASECEPEAERVYAAEAAKEQHESRDAGSVWMIVHGEHGQEHAEDGVACQRAEERERRRTRAWTVLPSLASRGAMLAEALASE
jgi:hypothetical protein